MNRSDALLEFDLSDDAPLDRIRSRYRELVKKHPPDRDPGRFERIRDAYQALCQQNRKFEEKVLGPTPLSDLDEVLERLGNRRKAVGPGPWLEVIREWNTRSK